ncbi:SDR family NAD(P)-dependent oxidoreductase [Actinoplanes sp. NPDC049265]|uniref:SDR family NAD(P)-dependent oxidoreductase n=1 Tax=Actinoplanes sp. NPDC049265 TaxID=3363902 RepID=UPI00371B22D7
MTTPDTREFAVITGASSGIGYELAKQFVEHDYDVLIVAEDAGITATAAELGATAVQADLATYEGCEEVYRAVNAAGRRLSALALNAGRGFGGDFVRETDLIEELNVIDVNVTGTVHLAKRLLPLMLEEGGQVLFTSSIASMMPGTYQAVYNASKSFVQSFAEALRDELRDTGVSVTALMPGPTETNFFHRAEMDDTPVGASKKDDPAVVAKQGFAAMMKGKQKVVAGSAKTKIQGAASKVMPDSAKAAMHRRMAEPGGATDGEKLQQ